MKQIDRDTIERIGMLSMVLMERAALAVTEAVVQMTEGKPERVWVACGTGNNGADGIAVGRMLHQKGYQVTVLLAGNPEHATTEHHIQQQIAENLGVPLAAYRDFIPGRCDIIVDAVFGIGLGREVEGEYLELITMLAAQKSRVVAVDIPSGIHADTGEILGIALSAERTVTFGYRKTGLLLHPGKTCAGIVTVADIGCSDDSLSRTGWDTSILEPSDLCRLPKRNQDSHKGMYGKLLVIAGSKGMSGAAYLSALAAYRAGAGLVKILTVEANRTILQSSLPEAVVAVYPEALAWEDADAFWELIRQHCDWATAIVLGPGLGQESHVKNLVEAVLVNAYVPIVLDADALNMVAANPHLTGYYTENIIITPHMGEMSRLTGKPVEELKAHVVKAARDYSNTHGITCVIKDAVTVIADKEGDTYLNTSGNSGMAKAGSGDVLTGIIGALAAQGMELKEAAAFGVYLHGLAGDAAANALGKRSVLAHEIGMFLSRIPWEDGEGVL